MNHSKLYLIRMIEFDTQINLKTRTELILCYQFCWKQNISDMTIPRKTNIHLTNSFKLNGFKGHYTARLVVL